MAKDKTGICYLVGAGPGDPGLMTLRGKECIEAADVLVYDHLCNPDFLNWTKPDAELIYAGKKSKNHAIPQGGINAVLVEKAKEGKVVTRLKGGDPLLFGRGGEEAEELAESGVPFEIIPGISSAIAGPAYAGIPVTHRDHCSQLTIFTGHEDPEKADSSIDYEQIAHAPGTKVMLMGVEHFSKITSSLLEAGADSETPVALIRWATTGRQETITGPLGKIAGIAKKAKFKAPSVVVFGEVVACRDSLKWFENRPLSGKKIAVTRSRKQAGSLARQLRKLGADVLEMPTIRIEPPQGDDAKNFAHLVADAHTYDWLIFTSPNGVEHFFEAFYSIRDDAREIGGCRIAAIGPGTKAKLAEYRIGVDLMPEIHVAEELANAFESEVGSIENTTMLWVRAKNAREVLSGRLTEAGVILDEAVAYQTVPETEDRTGAIRRFKDEGADIIVFTSSSTVEYFLELELDLSEETQIASIGPITSNTIREKGLPLAAEAKTRDVPGLTAAILQIAESQTTI